MDNKEWKNQVITTLNARFKGCNADDDEQDAACVWVGAPSKTAKNGPARANAIQQVLNEGLGGVAECIPGGGNCDYVKIGPPDSYPSNQAGAQPPLDHANSDEPDAVNQNVGNENEENPERNEVDVRAQQKNRAEIAETAAQGSAKGAGGILQVIEKMLQSGEITQLDPYLKAYGGLSVPLNCIFCGPPGTGKTYAAKKLLEKIECEEVCFHPATAYEDFVRAIESNGTGGFEAKNKVFADICDRALVEPDKLFAILIDEINRANLPAVMGELMTTLEYRGPDHSVYSPHAVKPKCKDNAGNAIDRMDNRLIVPENLLVIGTMNTADRSTGLLDYALRRRFVFFPMKPKLDKVANDKAKEVFVEVLGLFYKDLEKLANPTDQLAPEFGPDDVAIGHSYFMKDDWKFRAKYQVAPLLEEYVRDGIFTNSDNVEPTIDKLKKL